MTPEEKSREVYPLAHCDDWDWDKEQELVAQQLDRRVAFVCGYETAEKDLALTWEDIKTIEQIIATSDWYDFEINGKLWSEEFYEEVLKRFKEAKR